VTYTSTKTPSFTATPSGNQTPIIYPNPAPGGTVNLLPPSYSGSLDVRVEIFTAAFRKVRDTTYHDIPAGQPVQVSLTDRFGSPLASGVYYIRVTVNGHRSIAKLLILR